MKNLGKNKFMINTLAISIGLTAATLGTVKYEGIVELLGGLFATVLIAMVIAFMIRRFQSVTEDKVKELEKVENKGLKNAHFWKIFLLVTTVLFVIGIPTMKVIGVAEVIYSIVGCLILAFPITIVINIIRYKMQE